MSDQDAAAARPAPAEPAGLEADRLTVVLARGVAAVLSTSGDDEDPTGFCPGGKL